MYIHRLDNTSSLLQDSQSLLRPSPKFSKWEFSLEMRSLLRLSSGTTWESSTRLKDHREEFSPLTRSSKRISTLSRLTESFLSINLELLFTTCTRNSEIPLLTVPSLNFVIKNYFCFMKYFFVWDKFNVFFVNLNRPRNGW